MTITSGREVAVLSEVAYRTRELKIGVVGCGYWGPKLVRNFHDLPGAAMSMIHDLRPDRLAAMKTLYPALTVTANYQDLLDEDLDAIVIATPVQTHYLLAKAALLAGKHVLVEKPITARSDQAQELIDLAAERGLTLMVGHTFQYNPAVEAARRIVQAGTLGQVYYLNSTRVNLGLLQPDINVMWDLGPHDISMVRFILGADPLRVRAHGGVYVNVARGLHEIVNVTLVFAGEVLAHLRMSWLDPAKERRLTIIGSKMMLVYDDLAEDKVVVHDKGVEIVPHGVATGEFQALYRYGEAIVYPLEWVEPLQAECDHFLACIRSGAPALSGGEDGLKVVRILETAQRSLQNGGVELEIEY